MSKIFRPNAYNTNVFKNLKLPKPNFIIPRCVIQSSKPFELALGAGKELM